MKQRELARYKKVSIGIFDDKNFYVADICKIKDKKKVKDSARLGEEVLRDMHYFSIIEEALTFATRQVAGEDATTLEEYISIVREATSDIMAMCKPSTEGEK